MAFVFPDPPDEYDPNWMRALLQRIEKIVQELEDYKFVKGGWTVTTANITTARTVSASGASGTREQFATLVSDLINKGYLSGRS